ncbi:pseudouridine synthase [Paraburkholderia sp. MM5384-R2]|uniref:pseudouridine synthase n=1 Tax=Paraburkholderia sp. MM5384-R2 TaxID=2723097 RepID=UPI00161B4091|nr:pseudouridine synthase [Paraburkholderia sp. MM5384-R2]MBB5499013.1 23S rRNA pseudouridine2604 synthase [Paraburkholderia sp. MM5384-R2]
MRIKLTAKHPRPASSERAPVRPGSVSARKPTRPARPKPFEAEAGAKREGAASTGGGAKRPVGAKPAGAGARAPRAEGSGVRERGAAATGAPRRFEGAAERGERGERAPRRFEGGAERGERAPRREFGERTERAPRRPEGSAERGERGPRRDFGERTERAPRRFEGNAERGERAPRREFGERTERAPRRFEGNAERGERAPRREFGERTERAPRRSEGSAERGERAPRREFGERAERAPRRFEGNAERGERAPRRDFGERSERAPRRFEGSAERGERAPRREFGERAERAPRRFEGNAERGERAPRGFGERAPGRDAGERRPFSGPRPGTGRPSEGGVRGDRPVRREREAADRPRFGSDRGEPQERRGGDRGARSDSTSRRFESERGERSFAKPAKGGYGERTERRERPARSFDDTLPAANRRFGDDRPARAAKPRASASATARPVDTTIDTPQPPRRDREDAPGMLRLSKLMSKLGLCSRREADEWIEKGWVMVDGERVDTLGTKVFPDQRIDIDPAAEAFQSSQVTVIVHKPVGLVSGQAEDGYQPAITLVTPENRWEGDRSGIPFSASHLRQLAPAGRLDIDSTGLLVLTQDGRIAKQLIGGHSDVDKEYLVRVAYGDHTVDVESHFPAEKLALLRHGLSLDDVALKPAQVSWQNGEQLRFVLREGKKRQIRRMCELVGLEVAGLKRVRMGQVMLGALPPGQWRYLSEDESF